MRIKQMERNKNYAGARFDGSDSEQTTIEVVDLMNS
jgi:hypothetical protein